MGSPVDKEVQDALNRLRPAFVRNPDRARYEADLATVRSALEQLREERDAAQRMADHMVTLDGPNAWAIANAERHRAESAEAEVQRLAGKVYVLENMLPENYMETLEAAEAEVQRLREGLRWFADHGHELDDYEPTAKQVREKARALLADSPDGADTEGGEA